MCTSFSNPPPSLSFSKSLQIRTLILRGLTSFNHIKHVHASLLRFNLDHDTYLLNFLLKQSFHLGRTDYAHLLFTRTRNPNTFLYNTLLQGFVSNDCFDQAIKFYFSMRQNGFSPNGFTFPFALKACARVPDLELGLSIHSLVVKSGFDDDVSTKTTLLSLYAKCGLLDDAIKVFDDLPERNVVSCTAIISGYIGFGKYREAVDVFRRLFDMGVTPDSYSVVRVLSACAKLGDLNSGEWINGYVESLGIGRNVFVATALVDFYSKCGKMAKARNVFDHMSERDIIIWSTMIQGYAINGDPKEAVAMFLEMLRVNLKPDPYSMVGFLSACASLGALELGEWGSRLMDRKEFLYNLVLGTALIDMYAKCGDMARAMGVFKDMKQKDRVVLNAAMTGLAKNGHVKAAFALFGEVEKLGVQPDGNTFMGLLCGCTHAGLVDDGRRYFNSIKHVFSLIPTIEHYGCMVDLLGRAGLLNEARELIQDMPMEPNAIVWGALLGGCRLHRDTQLAEHVLKQLILLEPSNSGNYVLLSNIYSASQKWDDAAKTRSVMIAKGMQKIPAYSWIEVNGVVHEFLVGDETHPLTEKIYAKLDELSRELKELGFVPTKDNVLFDIEEEEKERILACHSEKLAIAFGLISTGPDDVIRVVKNLRVCGDCHEAIKLISKVTRRVINVRDNNRFHCFKEGWCSCNDYW